MLNYRLGCALVFSTFFVSIAAAEAPLRASPPATPEAATAARLQALRNDPAQLLPFLREMPKGGDLHIHLTGAVYAETYIRLSVEEGDCLLSSSMAIVAPPCDVAAGRWPIGEAVRDSAVYGKVVDALSMRNPAPELSGHDRFFATFGRFGPASRRLGDMLAEVTARAADERLSYLELMVTPDGGSSSALGRVVGWTSDLAATRERMLDLFRREDLIANSRTALDKAEALRNEIQGCGTAHPAPGCTVVVRYIAQVGRTGPHDQVFAQIMAGFELASADPRVVSLNLVQPEDAPTALANFGQQMAMLDFLHGLYPSVPVTLHAGELADGLVVPEMMRFHIRDSIRLGHARRIGHGVDVMSEDRPYELMRDMATQRIAVEVALTSNDVILGVRGAKHPLRTYLAEGVPVVLASDDLGVSRSTHTREFLRAVEEQNLDYLTLKRLVRNSLEFSFADEPTRARLRQDLEDAFRRFEAEQAHLGVASGRP